MLGAIAAPLIIAAPGAVTGAVTNERKFLGDVVRQFDSVKRQVFHPLAASLCSAPRGKGAGRGQRSWL
jgi:hypothetical protein